MGSGICLAESLGSSPDFFRFTIFAISEKEQQLDKWLFQDLWLCWHGRQIHSLPAVRNILIYSMKHYKPAKRRSRLHPPCLAQIDQYSSQSFRAGMAVAAPFRTCCLHQVPVRNSSRLHDIAIDALRCSGAQCGKKWKQYTGHHISWSCKHCACSENEDVYLRKTYMIWYKI